VGGTPVNNRVLIYNNVSSFLPGPRDPIPQTSDRCPSCKGTASLVLGQKNFDAYELQSTAADTMRQPLGVAWNGQILAVADTGNNRILIWKSLPTTNGQKADLVVGQKDFTSSKPGTTADTLRGPQGLFLDALNNLWVADTGNSRVLYYGQISANGQAAKFALGQPDLTANQQDKLFPNYKYAADTLLYPVHVNSDGKRLFIADLGSSRVLIWNTIPSKSAAPADLVLGQPDMTSGPNLLSTSYVAANNSSKLCPSYAKDDDGTLYYPALCNKTLNMPRGAMSDGTRFYVLDSGNDRIVVYKSFPTTNAQAPDLVLGQPSFDVNMATESTNAQGLAGTDSFRTPSDMAWDGTNLWVSDTLNRRVLVYTPGDFPLPITAVRNAAAPENYAGGKVTVGGTLVKDTTLKIKIGRDDIYQSDGTTLVDPTIYTYKTVEGDTVASIINGFVAEINKDAGDKYVLAYPNLTINAIQFRSRLAGLDGNHITLATDMSPTTSTITLTAGGATLSGGQNATLIAPFTLVTILGDDLTDVTTPVQDLTQTLPKELGGVEFYVDGLKAPVFATAPNRILAQIPAEVADTNSSMGLLRVKRADGSIRVSTAVGIPIIAQNPGVFSDAGLDPKPGMAYHYSSVATGTISVDGSVNGGDTITVTIRDREYSYIVQMTDTLNVVRDNLIAMINANDPEVEAYASGPFTRIRLRARVPGPEGNSIPIAAAANDGSSVIMTAFNTQLCCANQAGAPVTEANPAMPGETIVVLASGLGMVGPQAARDSMTTGAPYWGPALNDPIEFVSSLAGGKTANVLFAGLRRGSVGLYEVHLELNSDLETNPKTEVYIAQSYQVSNIFTIPVVNPIQ